MINVSFNQHGENFICSQNKNFKIFQSDEISILRSRELEHPIDLVEMLFQSNLIALVTHSQGYFPWKLMIWDENKSQYILEMNFPQPILAIRFASDLRFIILQREKVYFYNLQNTKRLDFFETYYNNNGTCSMCAERAIFATLGMNLGEVCIKKYDVNHENICFKAHSSQIHTLALNTDGTLLATSSELGTIIRIFDTKSGKSLCEFRRGFIYSNIVCLRFSEDNKWLACVSFKKQHFSIHIFKITQMSNFFSYILPIWSFAKFEFDTEYKCVKLTFLKNSNLLTITNGINAWSILFDPVNGGPCIEISKINI